MSESLYYFAYGSNLHPARLQARIPSAELIDTAYLPGYSLRFHKRGGDGSAKCDAWQEQVQDIALPGAVYQMAAAHKSTLDEIEGPGYRVDYVRIECQSKSLEAFCYISEPDYVDQSLQPFCWYKELVYRGAKYHDFCQAHLQSIVVVPEKQDQDLERLQRNQRILGLM